MMIDPERRVLQPGPAPAERVQWVAGNARPLEFTLEPGLNFIEAIRRPLGQAGGESAVLTLEGGAFGPFTYVVPAPAPTPEHAAFYSEFHRPPGISRLEDAAVTFGLRDGAGFLHCHGVWTGADGVRRGGHVIPDQTAVAEPIRARAWVLDGMKFEAQPDPETNFTLFGPVSGAGAAASSPPAGSSRRVSGPTRTSAARWKTSAATGGSLRPCCAAESPAPSERCSRMVAWWTVSLPRCSSGTAPYRRVSMAHPWPLSTWHWSITGAILPKDA